MQYIDNDMEELFNKAGNDYPLRTDNANWNAVQKALNESDADTPKKNGGQQQYAWLLLLLIVPFICITTNKNVAVFKNVRTSEKNTPQQLAVKTSTGTEIRTGTRLTNNKNVSAKQNVSITGNNQPARRSSALINKRITNESNTNENEIKSGRADLQEYVDDDNNIDGNNESAQITKSDSSGDPKQITAQAVTAPSNDTTALAKEKKPDPSKYKRTFYYGFIGGPDISTIKSQEVKDIGYSVGLLIGYHLTKNISLEAGVLWNKKKYYTDGKYYDKSGANIPAYVNINSLEGGCEMLEFPIVARYDFKINKRLFFATAGLTSYVMKKEDYTYQAQYGGGAPYPRYTEYKNTGEHLFSNMQLSVGYNHNITSKIKLRIEPYIKLPIRKIGIGKMPITSTGVYFGIVRDLK